MGQRRRNVGNRKKKEQDMMTEKDENNVWERGKVGE
jgi:hypothetical protein